MKIKTIDELTLDEKIGQLILAGFHTTTFNDHLDEIINNYGVGNIILFTRNFENAHQMRLLCQSIHKEVINKTGIIPFIAIDQEGGLVTRMMKDVTFAPGPMTSSASIPQAPYYTGKMLAKDMIKLGINFNLAPSLDVNNNPNNPVIGVRSLSDDPYIVAKLGSEFIKGTTEEGVLACCKHFPGHGDCEVDSHLGLPVIKHDLKRIHEVELVPFIHNIHTPAIMSAHILFPAYDSTAPATLSKTIITDVLRKELGYKGLVLSDCLEMKAIQSEYGTPRGALMAIKAGIDMVCISHTKEYQIEAIKLIKQAVLNNEITMQELDEHVQRILDYKRLTLKALEDNFYNQTELSFSPEQKALAQEIVDHSLTLIKGEIPSVNNSLIIAPKAIARTIIEDEFDERNLAKVLKKHFKEDDIYELIDDQEYQTMLLNKASSYQHVIIFSYNANVDPSQVKFINQLLSKYHTYVISLKGPMDYHKYENLNNYMCLYEYTPNSIRTVVKLLEGNLQPMGKCPIKL